MSGPPDNDARTAPGPQRRTLGDPGAPGTGGETSGDFGLDRAVAQLQDELQAESAAGPSAVDVMGSAPIRVPAPAPGATGRVVGAPPVAGDGPGAALSQHDLMPPDPNRTRTPHEGLTRAPVSDTGPQIGFEIGSIPGTPFPAATAGRSRDTPSSALPQARPGVQEPAFEDAGLRSPQTTPDSSAGFPFAAADSLAGGRVAAAGVPTTAGAVGGWRPPTASESAIAGYGRVATPSSPDVAPDVASHEASDGGPMAPDGNTERMAPIRPGASTAAPAESQRAWSAERTVIGRSPSPKAPPRPWLLYAIAGVVVGALGVALLMMRSIG